MLFRKTYKRKAWMIEKTNIDSDVSTVVGYVYSKADAELLCRVANQYTLSTRDHYAVLG